MGAEVIELSSYSRTLCSHAFGPLVQETKLYDLFEQFPRSKDLTRVYSSSALASPIQFARPPKTSFSTLYHWEIYTISQLHFITPLAFVTYILSYMRSPRYIFSFLFLLRAFPIYGIDRRCLVIRRVSGLMYGVIFF